MDLEVYRIKLGIPWPFFEVNVFLVGKGNSFFLIDCGFPSERNLKKIYDAVESIGGWRKIEGVILTHGHPDHYGNLPSILSEKKVPVFVHRDDEDRVIELPYEERKKASSVARDYLTRNGVPEDKLSIVERQAKSYFTRKYKVSSEDVVFSDEITIGSGIGRETAVRKLKLIHTPGHTPGHIIVHEEKENIVFSGDHIFSKGFPVPLLFFARGDRERFRNLPNWLRNLEKLREISPSKVFPGHLEGFSDVELVIEKMKRRVEKMKGRILDMLRRGPMTIYDVGEKLYPGIPEEFWSFKFSEAQGYIDLLEEDGVIESFEKDGKIFFVHKNST